MTSTPTLDPADPTPLYVEVSPLLYPDLTGIGRVTARLVEALIQRVSLRLIAAADQELAPRSRLAAALPRGREIAVDARDAPTGPVDLETWAHGLLRRPHQAHDAALAGRATGLFPWVRPPMRHFRRELAILHDFTPVLLPWTHQTPTRKHFGQLFTRTLELCDAAIANSRSTASDAAWLSGLPADRIVVSYLGPSICVHEHASARPVQRNDRLVLAVGSVEPRKNGRFLTDWFVRSRVLPADAELRWAGPRGWLETNPPRRSGRRRAVTMLGKVTDAALCELYREAAFLVYPSLYEGFGLPVLDALLHGTPVLTSFNSSLQEFEGPGVFYFDPYDSDTLDQAYRAMFDGGNVAVDRPDLRANCSWQRFAETILSLRG